MSKKGKKDAFYFFKLKFEEENQGKVFYKGITDVEVAARQSWRSMTLQQRDPYEDLAKQATPTQIKATKVDQKVSSENSIDAKNNKIVKEIVTRSVRSNTIQTEEYYFIAVNIFCETASNECFPAEIALLNFTLQDGVIRTYHTYINPGTIPLEYKFTALELSETTHRLPLPPNAMGEKNFASIQQEMNKFIGNAPACKEGFIPLFTLAENVRMVQSICEDLHASTSNEATNCRYKVLSIDQLLFSLKVTVGRKIGGGQRMESQFNSIDDATSQLNREKYTFLCEIACEFHDEKDCSKYCCLSDVKRWTYVFSDNVCAALKISLVGGKHFPIGTETLLPIDRKRAHNKPKATAAVFTAGVHHKSNCDLNANMDSLQLVDPHNECNAVAGATVLESNATTAVAAGVDQLKSNSDRKYNLKTNLDSQEVKVSSNATHSLPAKGNRRQRNYFAEDDCLRRSYGKGKSLGKGVRR